METGYEIIVRGLVQGVGFRPFIRKLAMKHHLNGEVMNRSDGVRIILRCDLSEVLRFIEDIRAFAPPAANIRSVDYSPSAVGSFSEFTIIPSQDDGVTITDISPDIAVCEECLSDLVNDPRRIDYPFVNCTNCGPRFTIVRGLPYDRSATTMAPFEMCGSCAGEYGDADDRRYHAQPVACNTCGPAYTLTADGKEIKEITAILREMSDRLAAGESVAVKSVGGYNLMCDALNEEAVAKMRRRKQRDMKPFAVMFRDIESLREYCLTDEEEEALLLSWRRPILILRQRKPLAPSVSSGLNTNGAMLPYMPVHHMLFRVLHTPVVVLTSGNLSEEPIIISDSGALRDLMPITGCVAGYNREIYNRADDSVARVCAGKSVLIRRSRGYAPAPVYLVSDAEGIFAAGAEQKSTFCIGRGTSAIMSQYIGDVKNVSTFDYYCETYRRFSSLFRFEPSAVTCDMHPDYLPTRFAEEMAADKDLSLIKVQHHHAHAVSVMAENGLTGRVIGVVMDGTGYGTDGNTWGSEFMIADAAGFERYTHFEYFMMPGGDMAVSEPWRMALSCLFSCFGSDFDLASINLFREIDPVRLTTVREMLAHNINSPLTCGAGRIFDAVSALLGLCARSSFDSEAPMRLESAVSSGTDEFYPFTLNGTVCLGDTFRELVSDIMHREVSHAAAKFHNTIAQVILDVCLKMRNDTGLSNVVISGGVFQNRYLLEKSLYLLSINRFRVYTNQQVPPNDGGISLGQLMVAAERRRLCV
ncbi:MAG: carbamoyltransferase HypF [Bacteroidota bacterium]|nr:carbamoyltransferase HypF [Bacteroidota bacterium]